MASAQLSSPCRAGAGSDLKETAPAAPGARLWERRAPRRAQGPGGAWANDPWHYQKTWLKSSQGSNLPGAAPRLTLASLPSHSLSARATARANVLRQYPLPTREGSYSARVGRKLPPHPSSASDPPLVPGARPRDRDLGWYRTPSHPHPETSAKLESQGARPAAVSARA